MKGFLKFLLVVGIIVGAFLGIKHFFPDLYDKINGFFHECKEFEYVTVLEPNCETDGKSVERCKKCLKETGLYEVLDKYGHNLGEWKVAKEATCKEAGLKYKQCLQCEKKVEEQTIEKLEHSASEWKIEKESTCIETGIQYKICLSCNERIEEETIEALGHKESEWKIETEKTCITDGLKYKTCLTCNERIKEEVINASHEIKILNSVAATCIKTGLTEGKQCIACNQILTAQTVINALDHDIIIDKKVEPTCLKTGLTEGSHCSRCDDKTIPQQTISKLDHQIVIDARVEPTCEKTGLTEGSHCSSCNTKIVSQKTISATGHDFNFFENKCTKCSKKEIEVEIWSKNDFEKYEGINYTKYIVYLDYINFDESIMNYINIRSNAEYVRIVSSGNKVYNRFTIKWPAIEGARLDLVNVRIEPNVKGWSPIVISTKANVTIGLYGTKCTLIGPKAGVASSISIAGGDGADGIPSIDASQASITFLVGTTSASKIVGGAGGDGQNTNVPFADGGNGGNGGVGIRASKIIVKGINGISSSNLTISGGAGGAGGKKFLGGSNGSAGSSGKATSVSVIYE